MNIFHDVFKSLVFSFTHFSQNIYLDKLVGVIFVLTLAFKRFCKCTQGLTSTTSFYFRCYFSARNVEITISFVCSKLMRRFNKKTEKFREVAGFHNPFKSITTTESLENIRGFKEAKVFGNRHAKKQIAIVAMQGKSRIKQTSVANTLTHSCLSS